MGGLGEVYKGQAMRRVMGAPGHGKKGLIMMTVQKVRVYRVFTAEERKDLGLSMGKRFTKGWARTTAGSMSLPAAGSLIGGDVAGPAH